MKKTNLACLFAAGLLATQIPSLTFGIKPAAAQQKVDAFRCYEESTNFWSIVNVIYITNSDDIQYKNIINFRRTGIENYSPERRCREVARRLNQAVKNEGRNSAGNYLLDNVWLTTGKVRSSSGTTEAVICYVRSRDLGCNSGNVILTLAPEKRRNPNAELKKLLDASAWASIPSSQQIWENQNLYVNLGEIVKAASNNLSVSPRPSDNSIINNGESPNPPIESPNPPIDRSPTGIPDIPEWN